MKFESVRCDECQRIQDGANHWQKMVVWPLSDGNTIALGHLSEQLRTNIGAVYEIHDLCGQRCAMLHIAKLLGWSTPGAAE